jgi:hypothetical protein
MIAASDPLRIWSVTTAVAAVENVVRCSRTIRRSEVGAAAGTSLRVGLPARKIESAASSASID